MRVTLLQAATLGRQSLAAGVCIEADDAMAAQWLQAGIATQTANETDAAQNNQPARVNTESLAIETIAPEAPQAPQSGKTPPRRKRGGGEG